VNETQLQIIVSLVDEATAQLGEVSGALQTMSGQASEAAATMSSSMDASFSTAEEAAIAAAQASLAQWNELPEAIATDFEEIVPTTDELLQSLVETNQQAAAAVASAWQTSGQAMEDSLAAAMNEVDTELVTNATAAGEAAGTAAGEGFGGYFKKMIIGYAFEQIGSFLSGGIESAIAAASQSQDKISTLTAQIQQQKASIAENEAALQKWTGTTVEVNAAHEKAAANIDAEKAKITELTQQLAPLTQAQSGLPGIINQIEDATLNWIGANKPLETSLQTLMTTAGPLVEGLGYLLIAVTLLSVAFSVISVPLLILLGGLVAIAGLTAIWVTFHTQIVSFLDDLNAKTGIINLFKAAWESISDDFTSELLPALEQLWTALQPLEPYLKALGVVIGATLLGAVVLLTDALTLAVGILTGMLTVGTELATFFTKVLVVALNAVETAIQAIVTAISKAGSAGGAITSAIGSMLSGAVKAFATGGIVTGPTLAMVGEAGPEAIIPLSAFAGGSSLAGVGGIGGGGGIQIFIQGGTYLDQGGANAIAQALATQIGRQIKLKNFF
jgi:hypothetical protein